MKLMRLLGIQKLFVYKPNRKRRVTSEGCRPARPFMLESLEPRLLLSGTPLPTEMPTTEPVAAVVTTDKPDYSPGETAVITTSNTSQEGLKFGDGETVQFQVTRTDGVEDFPMGNLPWYVTDGVGGFDAHQEYDLITGEAVDRNNDGMADWIRPDNDLTVNGSISTTWFVEDQYLGASLQLTATGQTSGAIATTQFTDSGSFGYTTTVGHLDTVTLAAGATNSTTLSVDVDAPKNNGNFSVSLTFATKGSTSIGIGSGADQINLTSVTRAFTTTQSTGDTDTFPITVSIGANVAPGTYQFRATAVDTPDNISDGQKWDFDIIVTAPVAIATTTTVSSSANPSTYGDSVTFTATVARVGSGAPAGSVNFTIQGIGTVAGTAGPTTATTATWTYTTSALTAGSHTVSASFTGSGSFSNSGGSLSGGQTVAQKTITGAFTANNKIYDGTTTAAIAGRSLSGVVGSDDVSLAGGTAAFDNKNVGTGKTVTGTGFSLTGAAAGNYTLASTTLATTADITALGITGNFTADNKVYDGTTAATVLTRTLSGVLAGDVGNVTLTGGTASFADKNVGTGKTVTLTGATLSGSEAGNYSLSSVNTTTADITAVTLTATIVGNPTKPYDGNTDATLTAANFLLTGVVPGESFTVTKTTGSYNSKDVATATTVSTTLAASDFLAAAGTLASNYILPTTASGAGHITQATLTGVATTQSALNIAKQGSLVFSLDNISGMVDGDTVASLLSSMTFTLKIGANTYAFAPSVAIDTHGDLNPSNDTVVVTYSLKNGGDAAQLAADLQALNLSDGIASTSASNAQVAAIWVNMSTANYTFSDDALTKLFNSAK